MTRRPTRIGAAVIAAALLCLWPVLAVAAAEQGSSAPQPAPTSFSPSAIPLSEIATRAAEVTVTLQSIRTTLAQGRAIQEIQAGLPNLRRDIDRELGATMAMLQISPTLEAIQARQKLWRELELEANRSLKILTTQAIQLRKLHVDIDHSRKTWLATREAAQTSNGPAPVLQQVDAVIASLDTAAASVDAAHGSLLDLQAAVAHEVARCESVMSEVSLAQEKAVGSLLTADAPPIWSAASWDEAEKSFLDSLRREMASSWGDVQQYVWSPARLLFLHVALFLATGWVFGRIGRRARRWTDGEAAVSSSIAVFDRPWSAAYIVSLLYTTGPFSPVPPTVQRLFSMAAFVPMIRLIGPLGPSMIRLGTVAGALFALEVVRKTLVGIPLMEQAFLAAEMIAGGAVLAWVRARGHFKDLCIHVGRPMPERLVQAVEALFVLGLALGLVSATLGYLLLARLLASSVLGIGFLVLLLYDCLQILLGLVGFLLSSWPLRNLQMVGHHCELLLHRVHRVLVWTTIATGVNRSLDHLGLFQPAWALGETLLTAKLERGSINLSLGDILVFLITVWAAYLLSAFIRFALNEDVYPRLQVPAGLSYAASSLLNYVILALGVVLGMAAVGVDLTRVTVMAGALGVGIGFGLQSVVNNFVSGLILLFERPIHVGDNIEIDGLSGEVRRIGIRASTIRTRQGAEIIIPNARLVSDNVTNWTLSDQLRRIDLPVGVNYGADPKAVIALLEQVARDHPRVLRQPAPHGLFVGLGDSAINFELRAWTEAYTDWNRVRSDLTTAVYDAVQAAGLSFPYPQHEVRLLNRPESNGSPDETAPSGRKES